MSSRTVEYYFSVSSPWAYLGHAALHHLACQQGARIAYKPLPLRLLFEQTGGLPLARRHPARQRYRMMELQRWREKRDLPFHLTPRHSPFDATLVDHAVVALVAHGEDPERFLTLAHAGIWEQERDLADSSTIAEFLHHAGHEASTVLARANTPASGAIYAGNLTDAVATGVFGAPSYVVEGEVFWGQDRLDLLDAMLASGRVAYQTVQ